MSGSVLARSIAYLLSFQLGFGSSLPRFAIAQEPVLLAGSPAATTPALEQLKKNIEPWVDFERDPHEDVYVIRSKDDSFLPKAYIYALDFRHEDPIFSVFDDKVNPVVFYPLVSKQELLKNTFLEIASEMRAIVVSLQKRANLSYKFRYHRETAQSHYWIGLFGLVMSVVVLNWVTAGTGKKLLERGTTKAGLFVVGASAAAAILLMTGSMQMMARKNLALGLADRVEEVYAKIDQTVGSIPDPQLHEVTVAVMEELDDNVEQTISGFPPSRSLHSLAVLTATGILVLQTLLATYFANRRITSWALALASGLVVAVGFLAEPPEAFAHQLPNSPTLDEIFNRRFDRTLEIIRAQAK